MKSFILLHPLDNRGDLLNHVKIGDAEIHSYRLWLLEERDGRDYFAKPIKIEFDVDAGPAGDVHDLPECTFTLRADQLDDLKKFIQHGVQRSLWGNQEAG